jgi:hypothetical protein
MVCNGLGNALGKVSEKSGLILKWFKPYLVYYL